MTTLNKKTVTAVIIVVFIYLWFIF